MSDETEEPRSIPYIRWQRDEPRKARREFPPLQPEHPAYHDLCPMCTRPLGDDHPVVLVAIGPNSEEAWEQHQAGRWYSAQAGLFHAGCVGDTVEVGQVLAELNNAWIDWTCPRCEFPLQVPAMAPWQVLHIGLNREPLIFHASCLGTDIEEPV